MQCVIIIVVVTKLGMHEGMNDKSDDKLVLGFLSARLTHSKRCQSYVDKLAEVLRYRCR